MAIERRTNAITDKILGFSENPKILWYRMDRAFKLYNKHWEKRCGNLRKITQKIFKKAKVFGF